VITDLDYAQFLKMVATRDRGIGQQKRLYAIWERARDSIGCEAGKATPFEAKVMVEGLKQVRQAIGETEAQIKDACLTFPECAYLLTIPGFGPDVSSKVLGAVGDPFRFESHKQVIRMAGFDLSANRSGKTSDCALPVISKRGKADLRYALYQAAFIASLTNRCFAAYYTNKLKGRERERGIKTKMRVKLAAKLLVIAWTLMKKREPFHPEYLTID
jgi:transposase